MILLIHRFQALLRRAVADRYGVPWTLELSELQGVRAAVLAASTEAHYTLVARVLERGCRSW
ncbi:MAG: hypothetical protein LC685_05380 [Actinobacteria bacterium]|nr:hypothetical protein [Actinomycetota bacterium]